MDDPDALILLAHAAEPGDPRLGAWIRRWGAGEVLQRARRGGAGVPDWVAGRLADQELATADQARERAARAGARIVLPGEVEWPGQLDDLRERAPLALWVAGAADLRLLALRSVAVVGARACSAYGERVATEWAAHLASAQWTVVSGAAYGIDAAAHRGAMAADGTTVAALASGVDVAYPRGHDALLARVLDAGAIVSEVPPGVPARRQRFLTRNRLIAALTRATVVVEAAARSGSLATARSAASLGRVVLAVPGPVWAATSAGCHRLVIEEQALLAGGIDDVLSVLDLTAGAHAGEQRSSRLSSAERAVLDGMPARGVRSLERIAAASALPVREALGCLGRLEAQDWVRRDPQGWSLAPRARLPGPSGRG